ncbi:PhoX family phosphatase [Pseudonocardiaceae bacterium YIM PH 21723]|nr:PhoX family phosphatase [Pseudonocardiaceae bacterium YIM PH 21723]
MSIHLPLLGHNSGRAAVTCEFRCGNACAHDAPNTSDNAYFGDIVRAVASRRGVLKAGAVLAVAAGAGLTAGSGVSAAAAAVPGGGAGTRFTPVAPNLEDRVVVPPGYDQQVLIRWGDPVLPGAPKFDFDKQTSAAQAMQFGFNNDFVGLVQHDSEYRWFLVVNHEYTTEQFMFRGWTPATTTAEQTKIAWAAHGLTVAVVERDRRSGRFTVQLDRRYNRRITVGTEFALRGPAAGSAFLKTAADPTGTKVFGTFANCAGGVTPWGTVLSGEENFNGYFANADKVTDPAAKARLDRYGFTAGPTVRRWEDHDKRFDLAKEPNEANRFGWVVEIDPREPDAPPIKHTALGRFKHEAANVRIAKDGRVVVYMGDDERFDYIYKFVSDGRVIPGTSKPARTHNKALLDKGTLYVARFTGDPATPEFDGTGQWIPLVKGNTSFVPGFTAEEVYVFTRLAADKAGATKMDRPEDIEANPRTGRVYAALTNNTRRGAAGQPGTDDVNPRANNKDGHVLEWEERGNDAAALAFSWKLLLVCGDPKSKDTYFGGYDKTQVSPISCPDNVAFDPRGNLWISTDGNTLGANDGLFAVPVAGPERGHVKQFLTVPRGAETCGPVVEDDFILVAVQHPGELDGASADKPVSHWPDGGNSQPRPSIVAVYPQGNGHIGQ